MRRHGRPNIFGLIIVLIIFANLLEGLLDSLAPLLIIAGIVMLAAGISVNASKKKETMGYSTSGSYRRTNDNENQKISRINAYLNKWFRSNHSMYIGSDLELVCSGNAYSTFSDLDVYKNHSYLCKMNEFQNRFPDSYKIVVNDLYERANAEFHDSQNDIVDVEATVNEEKPKTEKKAELSQAEKYIQEINSLNTNIPDEQISKDLFETCAYLKQIDELSRKLPNTKEKLNKLYEHYLPILIKILKQYESLQSAVTDPSYEETREKLSNTIQLINTAMKNIISSMTDQDFINLSADISTLEAVLKKDGLTDTDQLLEQSKK